MKTIVIQEPQAIPSAHTFAASEEELVLVIQNPFNYFRRRTITITDSVHALTGLRFTWAATIGGTHVDRAADDDFNTATDRWTATTNLYQLDADSGQIDFDFTGIAELKIYATSTTGAVLDFEIN